MMLPSVWVRKRGVDAVVVPSEGMGWLTSKAAPSPCGGFCAGLWDILMHACCLPSVGSILKAARGTLDVFYGALGITHSHICNVLLVTQVSAAPCERGCRVRAPVQHRGDWLAWEGTRGNHNVEIPGVGHGCLQSLKK